MKNAEADPIERLRRALLTLPPTGPLGFEGLTGLVLGTVIPRSSSMGGYQARRTQRADVASANPSRGHLVTIAIEFP